MTQYLDLFNTRLVIGFYGKDYAPHFAWQRAFKCIPLGIANLYVYPRPKKV